MINPEHKPFWDNFIQAHPEYRNHQQPQSFYFCDNQYDADDCANLVVRGIKQATATSLWWFEKFNEPLPKKGDMTIVTNWEGVPMAIIETTQVVPRPYHQIDEEFAATEGEGDGSLEYWQRVHKAYYNREMNPHGEEFHEDMIIMCEYFRTVYTP